MKKTQEQVKKAFCYQKLFWPFTVWINCSKCGFKSEDTGGLEQLEFKLEKNIGS